MKSNFLILTLTLLSSMAFGQAQWKTDHSHSNIRFTITHMLITEVEGKFNDFEATVSSEKDDFDGAEVDFTAKVVSIDTENEKRDNHLKSDDFFSADKFPEIKFKGHIVKEGSKYFLKGDFTIRDVTKAVTFDVKYNGNLEGKRGRKAGFKVTGSINRFDYGLKWNNTVETGGLVVSEDVEITCNIELNEIK